MKLKTVYLALAISGVSVAYGGNAWEGSEWISAADAPTFDGKVGRFERAAPGTSWFSFKLKNPAQIVSAKWLTAGLGVYEVYVNGKAVGDDFLKPGYTHSKKTKYSFSYDVTNLLKKDKDAENFLTAEVSSGWWRDKIVGPIGHKGFFGRKSAFRGVLEIRCSDGKTYRYGTCSKRWKAGTAGAVTQAAIFDGEEYDARIQQPLFGEGLGAAEPNTEFKGELLPSRGAEVFLRRDLALAPIEAYCWKGRKGANCEWTKPVFHKPGRNSSNVYGTVVKTRTFKRGETIRIPAGETLVVDFGQNTSAVPEFRFKAMRGTVLTAYPAEMLNDGNGERSRGNDGPAGSVYRENLRCPEHGMRVVYTFAGNGVETYMPRFTFFGYRYMSVSATSDVEIESLKTIPVTSITKKMEIGRFETGNRDINRLISNIYWGQISNYLSVPTDCPQRNERLGWTADTQVFAEAASFNADTVRFLNKWMRDLSDTQYPSGAYPSVAPLAQYGSSNAMRFGWADAGVIVPYLVWRQFGDTTIIRDNWASMEKYMARVAETKYVFSAIKRECGGKQYADWLSFEKLESAGGSGKPGNSVYEVGPNGKRRLKDDAIFYWNYLGACYWLWDAKMMATMAEVTGADAAKYRKMEAVAYKYLRDTFFNADNGMLPSVFDDMQTPALFALMLNLVEGEAKVKTKAALRVNVAKNNGCLQTGFLGTSILMDTLTENGMSDLAYDILLNHNFPGWLYSVDQGATTIWERWNSYTKDKGFGPVGMNSFNHYAYGTVLAWMYKTCAGIAAVAEAPGFRRIKMSPIPDRRLGYVKAEYKSAAGLIKSEWHFEGKKWIWNFTVPQGSEADVTLPGESTIKKYTPGSYTVELVLK